MTSPDWYPTSDLSASDGESEGQGTEGANEGEKGADRMRREVPSGTVMPYLSADQEPFEVDGVPVRGSAIELHLLEWFARLDPETFGPLVDAHPKAPGGATSR